MGRIKLEMSERAVSEGAKGFQTRLETGFWDRYIRTGTVVDVGYSGGRQDTQPLFKESVGLDLETPGYNGRDMPYPNDSIATIHASHLLEHIADYGHFLRECLRVLYPGGTLIIMVPLMQAYENALVPPSSFNVGHARFYTAARLCFELESSLDRKAYRIIHLKELFNTADLGRAHGHAVGPHYEIECVIEKVSPGRIYED